MILITFLSTSHHHSHPHHIFIHIHIISSFISHSHPYHNHHPHHILIHITSPSTSHSHPYHNHHPHHILIHITSPSTSLTFSSTSHPHSYSSPINFRSSCQFFFLQTVPKSTEQTEFFNVTGRTGLQKMKIRSLRILRNGEAFRKEPDSPHPSRRFRRPPEHSQNPGIVFIDSKEVNHADR